MPPPAVAAGDRGRVLRGVCKRRAGMHTRTRGARPCHASHTLVRCAHACARARRGPAHRAASATVPKPCVLMPSRSAVINTQHKGSSRRWGLGKQQLNHFAFSPAELLLMRGRRSGEPFLQNLARVPNYSGGRPRVTPASPPPRQPGTWGGVKPGMPSTKIPGRSFPEEPRG